MANVDVSIDQGGSVLRIGDAVFTWNGTNLIVTGLPTSDPAVAGALYTATGTGVVTVSAG